MRIASPETHETRADFFSFRIFPRSCMDLPGAGEVEKIREHYFYENLIIFKHDTFFEICIFKKSPQPFSPLENIVLESESRS